MRCNSEPTVERVPYGPLERFRGCSGRVEVMWRVYRGGPHSWPKGELRDDAATRMWRFFSRTPD
jgi:poly(3-hydroxybutyrate) depolymerase